MTNTIYIHQPEKAFSFTRLPNFLFEAPTFKPLSNEAKVLYAFILRRTELSRKNGWADDCGRIYLYYPICEVVDLLHCGRQKAVNTLRELQYAGLVEIQKQGCGKPNRIFPKSYEAVTFALAKKHSWQIKYVRIALDAMVVLFGMFLGGKFGMCTICTILLSGVMIQKTLQLLHAMIENKAY